MIKRRRIRYISLHFDYINNLVDENHRVQFNGNSRFISNYLSKAVRKITLEADAGDINMIGVCPHKGETNYRFFRCDNVFAVYLHLSQERLEQYYKTVDLVSRYEFYLSLLEEGYRVIEPVTGIKAGPLLALHQQLRENGYKNEWTVKKMLVRDYGIGIMLTACFTFYDYHLNLTVYDAKSKNVISEGTIYRTPPSEFCYDKEIRKVYAKEGYLYVDDFLDYHFLRLPLENLQRGEIVTELLQPEWGENFDEEIKQLVW